MTSEYRHKCKHYAMTASINMQLPGMLVRLAAGIIRDTDKQPQLASSGSISGGERRRFGETGYRFRRVCAVGISEIGHSPDSSEMYKIHLSRAFQGLTLKESRFTLALFSVAKGERATREREGLDDFLASHPPPSPRKPQKSNRPQAKMRYWLRDR